MQITENYRLKYDENNVVLQFHEMRQRKSKETGEKADFEFTEDYYYPTVKTALNAFLHKETKNADTVQDLINRIDRVEQIITNLKF